MRHSFNTPLLLIALSLTAACSDTTEPDLLTAPDVVGVWAFNRTTPSGCAPSVIVTISEAREASSNTFDLFGSWRSVGSSTAETAATGTLSRLTRDFEIFGAGEKIEGRLYRDGGAIARWESTSCTDDLVGVKAP
jgi:hypothetical protein